MFDYFNTKSELRSSILDVSVYRDCCLKASQDENVFKRFKRCKDIEINIESVNQKMGEDYLSFIKSRYPFLLEHFQEFAKNDLIGSPRLIDFSEIGMMSPTTLRYIKTLGDLVSMYGPMDGWNIAEIGGGYGGQCRIISSYSKLKSYALVDLFETLSLAKKYLDQYQVANMSYLTMDTLPENGSYDLVISNYAFTECQKHVQKLYIEKIIKNSRRGYMICNFTSHVYKVTSYKLRELLDVLESYQISAQILEEEPYCGNPDLEPNVLLAWSK